jgi:hypothetical protein
MFVFTAFRLPLRRVVSNCSALTISKGAQLLDQVASQLACLFSKILKIQSPNESKPEDRRRWRELDSIVKSRTSRS